MSHYPRLQHALFFLCLGSSFCASGQQAEKVLEVADCVKMMRADSVHMYFDASYALSPLACAAIRRESRMDATGSFVGEVRDYRQTTNSLMHRIHYAKGVRDGKYEQYYENQQFAMTGQYTAGNPSGIWQFWYPNGKNQQTLEWTGQQQPSLRIIAYWDATGQQQVTNGTGTWSGTTSGLLSAQFGGPVVGSYQQGVWESRSERNNDLLTVEEFKAGRLRAGKQFVGGEQRATKPLEYKDHPSLEPQLIDASLAAEPFHLGKSCTEQAALAKASAEAKALMAIKTTAPLPVGDATTYQNNILRRLQTLNNATQWMPRTDGQAVVITATVDPKGYLNNVECETAVLASSFASFNGELGPWHPATANGRAVPGKLRFTLRAYNNQLQSQLQTAVAYPLPPEVIQDLKK